MKKRQLVLRAVRHVLSKAGRQVSPSTSPRASVVTNTPSEAESSQGAVERIEYNDGTDIVATDELAVLVGLVGLQLGLEPRGRPLVAVHWATWCDGCSAELPHLVELRRQTRGRADFVGVGWEGFQGIGTPEDWVAAVDAKSRAHAVDWSTMVFEGQPDELFQGLDLGVHTVPQIWVYDTAGRVVKRIEGEVTSVEVSGLQRMIEEL